MYATTVRSHEYLSLAAATAIALAACLTAGCTSPAPRPVDEELVVQVVPFAVTGQVDGADYLGRAMAESLSIVLGQSRDLRLLEVPAAADSTAPEATRLLKGRLIREEDNFRAQLQVFKAGREEPLWETEIYSGGEDLSGLAVRLSAETLKGLGASIPDQYPYIFDLTGGPAMASSDQLAQAVTALRRNDTAGFLGSSTALVEEFPEEPAAHALNAMALLISWDAVPSDEVLLERLKERLIELERMDPATPYDDFVRAYIYRSSGRPDRARELYSGVLARTDLSVAARAWALRQRSFTYSQVGNDVAARDDAERAVGLDPANASSLAALGRVLENLGKTDEAIVRSRQALALESSEWRQHQRLGLALIRAGRLEEAADSIGRACRIGSSQEACANVAVALERGGKSAEARVAAAHAESLEATRWGYYNLACYQALAGRSTAALDALRRSIELGFANLQIKDDPDLEPLRSDPRFSELVDSVEERLSIRQELLNAAFPWQT